MSGVTIQMDSINKILSRRGLEEKGKVQRYIDNEVIRLSEPYTPHLTGALKRSAKAGTDIGSGEVVWNSPYARFHYYGNVMISPSTGSTWAKKDEKKILTDRPLSYHGGGGKLWFERMKADHRDKILEGAAKKAGGRAT